MPVPSLVTPIAPPLAPVEFAIALPWVKVPAVAVLVSKPSVAPACKPAVALPAPEILVSRVLRLALLNPAVPAEST